MRVSVNLDRQHRGPDEIIERLRGYLGLSVYLESTTSDRESANKELFETGKHKLEQDAVTESLRTGLRSGPVPKQPWIGPVPWIGVVGSSRPSTCAQERARSGVIGIAFWRSPRRLRSGLWLF